MPYHKYVQNFNAGELSPFLSNRTDVAKYESGCQILENMVILPYGGVMRRPGTQYLGKAKFPNLPCRLIGFNFSVTTNFILELGHTYIRFWTNGIQVMTPGAPAFPLEKVTPYNSVDLRQIQYCQINDIMYLTHPSYLPQKLSRLADDNWTFAEVAFKWPPLLDENVTQCTITPSGTSGSITLTSNCGIFEPTDVGSVWQIGHNMAGGGQTYVECVLGAANANSGLIRVRGPWTFTTFGTWEGEVRINRTIYRTGVLETIRTYNNTIAGQRNVSTTGTEDEDCSLQIYFYTHGVAGSSSPIARLEFSNARVYGLVKLTGITGPQSSYADVIWGLARTDATPYWSKPAFSGTSGYPRCVCLHEQRLWFGGTKLKPLSLHGSQIDDFENFQRGSGADVGLMFNLSSNESNPINWMISQTKMLIGTAGGEWSVGATNADQAMGPGNIQARQQSNFGSSYLQARAVNEVVLFSQRQSHKVRELTYSFQKDGWVAPDLTILASHIASDGFVEHAFAQQPDAIFWCVTSDGLLVGMTYERDQNVVGWHRHTTQGSFESVATIYGGSKADELWMSVKRHINGVDVRYIERFDPSFRPTMDEEDKGKYWYLDCGFRSGGSTETTVVNGLSHLNGCTVGVLGDGANQPQRVVTGGQVTIQEPAKLILLGLPFTSRVRPMNLNIPVADTSQGRKVRIHKMVVRFYKSLTAKFSSDGTKWDEVFFRDREDLMDSSPSVFTGDREVFTGANFNTAQAMTIAQDRPFPLCILALIYWSDTYGE